MVRRLAYFWVWLLTLFLGPPAGMIPLENVPAALQETATPPLFTAARAVMILLPLAHLGLAD